VDVPTTMAAVAGANWTLGKPDGLNVWDAIAHGAPSQRTEVPLNVDTCVGPTGSPPCGKNTKYNALIDANWKLIEANYYPPFCPNATWCTGAGFYDGWWTPDPYAHVAYNASQASLPAGLPNGGLWLFDLSRDPNEEANVAASHPAVVQRMRARLAALADPSNGYQDPQANFPSPLALPPLHNGTWSPYRKRDEEPPPLSESHINSLLASLPTSYWD